MIVDDERKDATFGSLLRIHRERAIFRRRTLLSQNQFASEISKKTGLYHTRNLVSNWENDKSSLHPQKDRQILLTIISILQENGGITSLEEANHLLEAGNYRALSPNETKQIFPEFVADEETRSTQSELQNQHDFIQFIEDKLLHGTVDKLKNLFEKAEAGPLPAWPRKIAALITWLLGEWSIYQTVCVLGWMWAWVLSFWLIIPSLHWPFPTNENASYAMVLYIAGTFSIPLIIGLLTNTKNDKFWQEHHLASDQITRLYVYQGSIIGFHIGYIVIFVINLLIYYLGLHPGLWFELIEITFPLLTSYISGWLVPYNLWRAYKRLNLADAGIFFVFVVFGLLWGVFFYNFYSFLLDPMVGIIMILLAVSLLAGIMAWQYYRTGITIIPTHVWVFLYGFVLVLYQITIAKSLFEIVSLAGLITTLSVLLLFERIRITLRGMIGFLMIACLLLIIFSFNIWAGRMIVILTILIWWRWGKKFLSFPLSFWCILIAVAGISWGLQYQLWSDIWASVSLSIFILLFLLLEYSFIWRQNLVNDR